MPTTHLDVKLIHRDMERTATGTARITKTQIIIERIQANDGNRVLGDLRFSRRGFPLDAKLNRWRIEPSEIERINDAGRAALSP